MSLAFGALLCVSLSRKPPISYGSSPKAAGGQNDATCVVRTIHTCSSLVSVVAVARAFRRHVGGHCPVPLHQHRLHRICKVLSVSFHDDRLRFVVSTFWHLETVKVVLPRARKCVIMVALSNAGNWRRVSTWDYAAVLGPLFRVATGPHTSADHHF